MASESTIWRGLLPMRQQIDVLGVSGFKSISGGVVLHLADISIFCGSNSSGKSSFMQPFLLLKQTLESEFDPGPMMLHGPHVSFSLAEQIVPHKLRHLTPLWTMHISLGSSEADNVTFDFKLGDGPLPIKLEWMSIMERGEEVAMSTDGDERSIEDVFPAAIAQRLRLTEESGNAHRVVVKRDRFVLEPSVFDDHGEYTAPFAAPSMATEFLRDLICLPGLRGNAERTYPLTATPNRFPGPFQRYTASLIAAWQREDSARSISLLNDLKLLRLTSRIEAKRVDDTRVEIRVSRSPDQADEMVSIADVGIGTSQVLPVLVALHAAAPGQFVYVEQPELHLHPRAQAALAGVLVSAVNRGVRLIIETHSPALLQALQIQIAEGKLDPERARFHWFQRDEEGTTRVNTVTPGSDGAYGDWPEDFSEIDAKLDDDYLDATLFKGMKDAG